MKYLLLAILFTMQGFHSNSQEMSSRKMINSIRKYYEKHPSDFEYAISFSKSPIGYDTIIYHYALLKNYKNNRDNYIIGSFDSLYNCNYIFGYEGKAYSISNGIKFFSKPVLSNTGINWINNFPSQKVDNLESYYGIFNEIIFENDVYLVNTPQNTLIVDPLTFRIIGIKKKFQYSGKNGYTLYIYKTITDTLKSSLQQKIFGKIDSAKEVSSSESLHKKNTEKIMQFEGKDFSFDSLKSINNGVIDKNKTEGKFLLIDFFFTSCYPCYITHQQINNVLGNIDTSSLLVLGINPVDKKSSIQEYITEYNIKHPLIIGSEAEKIAAYYNIFLYPTIFLIAPNGKIEKINVGLSEDFIRKIKKIIQRKKE